MRVSTRVQICWTLGRSGGSEEGAVSSVEWWLGWELCKRRWVGSSQKFLEGGGGAVTGSPAPGPMV